MGRLKKRGRQLELHGPKRKDCLQMNYNTKNQGRTRRMMTILLAVLAAAGIGWLIGSMAQAEDRWEPDAEYPMANSMISWGQTFHAGAWVE